MYRIFVNTVLCLGIMSLSSFGQDKKRVIPDRDLCARIHDTIMERLKNSGQSQNKELFFYFTSNIQLRDSFTVIDANYDGYAVIVHDKYSQGHSSFSSGKIRKWKDDRIDVVTEHRLAECGSVVV